MKKSIILKCLTVMVVFCVCINITSVFAYNFPKAFWAPNESYGKALENKNYNDIIKYGKEVVDIMINEPECSEKLYNLASKYREIAVSYTELGDPQKAYEYFSLLDKLIEKYPIELSDWAYITEKALNRFESRIDLYTDGGVSPDYNAVNEKGNGILFGVNADSGIREEGFVENESIVLTYHEFGEPLLPFQRKLFIDADESGIAVEFALNCPKEAENINAVKNYEWSLREVSELISEFPDVPVFLRFAAEFDVWGNIPSASSFISAFRYVSDYFKSRHSNVAMVWSPNQASGYEFDLDSYYPGDEYVDWVGMSSYATKYFLGNANEDPLTEMFFKTGPNSHPVVAVSEIVEKYGDRKPIMISEMGAGHYIYNGINEDTTWFAQQRLREYYLYLPMVYPQIKVMLYFDHYLGNETNDFRLSENWILKKEFCELTKGERFIQDSYYNSTGFCYNKIYNGLSVDGIFPVSCFAYANDAEIDSVTYYIDDKFVAMSNDMPYTVYIDANNYSGNHNLKAVAKTNKGFELETESTIKINGEPRKISVDISGKKIEFDQNPVLYNDRTMVPLRKIFEELGAIVTWDDETQTATAEREDVEIQIKIGSSRMYVNDEEIILDTPAIILSDRTLVPVRAIAEGLNCDVKWNDASSTVEITQ